MRIGADHSYSSTTNSRGHVASQPTDKGFADSLASAVDASESETETHPPELSAATYRLFAAIELERGDTKHAALHLSRVADAREAGLPLHPSGALSELGRWDYTEAAAALPETGIFDSRSGQGVLLFTSYGPRNNSQGTDERTPVAADRPPSNTADRSGSVARSDGPVDRLDNQVARLFDRTTDRTVRVEQRASLDKLLADLQQLT